MKRRKAVKNLFLIGNGFDRWQNLSSSYDDFRQYYQTHIDTVMREMSINRVVIANDKGEKVELTPVDLIFGNPFDPGELKPEFFWQLEESMNKIDDQSLNEYFGRDKKALKRLAKTVSQAKRILQKIFSDWIVSLDVKPASVFSHRFEDDSVFINFNYTDTLEKRFGIDPENIFHIHGEAKYPATIVVGHASHPEQPFDELLEQKFIQSEDGGRSPRLEGLYYIECVLYETDKHIQDNLNELFLFFSEHDIHIEDIENIYVLGMSLSEPDLGYIDCLYRATKCGYDFNTLSSLGILHKDNPYEGPGEDELLESIAMNIAYATHRRNRELNMPDLPYPEAEAKEKKMNQIVYGREDFYDEETAKKAASFVHQRFMLEQAVRDKEAIERLCRQRRYKGKIDIAKYSSVLSAAEYLDGGHTARETDAKWIISFHSDSDKKHIDEVMQKIGCNNYEPESSIDKCLVSFQI